MKKALTILLVAIFAFAVFADGNTVTVKSIVIDKISIAEAADNANEDGGKKLYELFVIKDDSSRDNDYTSNTDISAGNVVANFVVKQNAAVKTNEQITLNVTCGQLTLGENHTDSLVVSDPTGLSSFIQYTPNITGPTLAMTLLYKSAQNTVAKDTELFTFKSTWTKKATLSENPGTYVADITLAFVIQ